MLSFQDRIILNAVGVNGTQRETVSAEWNGDGTPITEGVPPLNLGGGVSYEDLAAQVSDLIEQGLVAEAASLLASTPTQEEGDLFQVIKREVTSYLTSRGWRDKEDGPWFVFDSDKMVISAMDKPDGSRIVLVQPAAVFGRLL